MKTVSKLSIGLVCAFLLGTVTLPSFHLHAQTGETPTASVTPSASATDLVDGVLTPTATQVAVTTPTPTDTPTVELTPTAIQSPTPVIQRGSIYFDFEDGDQGWVGTGLWHRTDRWLPETIYDTPTSWWFGDEVSGTYNVGKPISGTLTSPRLLLEAAIPVVMYKYRYAIEHRAPKTHDLMRVQMSRDDGLTWQDIEFLNQAEPFLPTRRGGGHFELPQYMGQIVMLRFVFDSVDAQENDFEGWFVDDVLIKYISMPLPPPTRTLTPTPTSTLVANLTPQPTDISTATSVPRPTNTTVSAPLPAPSAATSVSAASNLAKPAPPVLPITGANLEVYEP